ncbi:MAG: M23 family peptidase [Deltaproteobacteria bacterium HGW-Deltaproteobacteria-18]|jgi:murein DD-endopeptidase MepM/ murein hydrolase activator NlpD|nr:MAG: M23 family peptidase [Deltaproteobacteria bacterium HGW-Deltaproteobacteria-20]PKN43640.1 MAG: M23 family peptidase [Deltaproteobacteria bacterium HGW-Deltaproteobacteria-18]
MMLRRFLFFILLATALLATPGSGLFAAQLRLECPEVVGIGLPFVVRVESDEPLDRLRVEWAGKKLDVPGAGKTAVEFLLGTDVLKSRPGTETLRILKLGLSPLAVQTSILVENREFPEQRLTVPTEMASPPAAVQERIARENAEVRAVLDTVTPDNHLVLPLMRPVPGEASSAYGLKRFFNDLERNPHRGLDLRAALKDPVRAAAPGRIVLVADHYYGGRSVFLDHGLGVFTVYMHLDEFKVRQGDMVEAGEILGLAGQTGRVTGPHLHLGLYVLDLAMDPAALFFANSVQ